MRRFLFVIVCTLIVVGLGALLGRSESSQSQPVMWQPDSPSSVFHPVEGVSVAGAMTVAEWEIPEDVTVTVTSDLEVECSGDITIRGRLIAADAVNGDGVSISLRTPGTVSIAGRICAGDGASVIRAAGSSGSVGLDGGHGGDVYIEAASVVGSGEIHAGDGGEGVLGGRGGDAGHVVLTGSTAALETETPLAIHGGHGGRGGDGVPGFNDGKGGDGGDGGDALVIPADNGTPGDPGNDDIKTGCAANGIPIACGGVGFHPYGYAGASAVGGDGGNGGNGTSCGDGGTGGRGGNAQSQCGGNGSNGANCSPSGGVGWYGGDGGMATGGKGGNGGNGGECCCGTSGPGGDGGVGGLGGNAFSGNGGNGGIGGNSTQIPFLGPGGNGGNGGNGGAAIAGNGGNGGAGAKGTPVGSGGTHGNGGTASGGFAGSGGAGGTGIPAGTPGSAGVAGVRTQGTAGANGGPGTTTCATHNVAFSEHLTSSVPPPPSPGIEVGLTAMDRQSYQSGGYRIGRNSNVQCRSMCWTRLDHIPTPGSELETDVQYATYDGFTTLVRGLSSGGVSRARHPNLAMDDQDGANIAFWQREDVSLPYESWLAQFPFPCQSVNTSPQRLTQGTPSCPEYIEPRIAVSQRLGAPDIIHVIARPNEEGCPNELLIYLRYDGTTWSGPVPIDVTPGYGYAIAADANSDKVAIVMHMNSGGLLNIVYYVSQTAGAGWVNGTELGAGNRNAITNYIDPATGIEAGYYISAAYDRASALNVIWDERQPTLGSTAAFIRHWNSQGGVIRPVAAGLWTNPAATGIHNLNLSNLTIGIGDGCTSCPSGSGSNLDALYVLYTQFGGNTPQELADHSATGYMNGELYLTTSLDHGFSWSPPKNLTSTKTPECDPGVADVVTGVPQFPDNVCRSENWATIGMTVNDIDILYVSDLHAGAAPDGEGTWQMNTMRYLCLPGGTPDAQYVCPSVGPNWYAVVNCADACPPHAAPGASTQCQLIVHNFGNGPLSGSSSATTTIGPPGMVSVPGSPFSLPPGSPELILNVTLDASGIATEGIYSGIVTITSNGQPSPLQIPIDFYVFANFIGGDDCQPAFTPAGNDVAVAVNDFITVTFSEVTTPGLTTVTTSTSGPSSDPSFILLPSGTPIYYEIETTADFVPPVTVCFTYDPALDPAPACPFAMKLGHYDGASWVDVTTEWDCNAYYVCGEVSSLSPFALGQSACVCNCWADPACDGVRSDVLDVVQTVNVAFRGISGTLDPGCTVERTDVEANGSTSVTDVVKVINVAFRGQSVASNYINPCGP